MMSVSVLHLEKGPRGRGPGCTISALESLVLPTKAVPIHTLPGGWSRDAGTGEDGFFQALANVKHRAGRFAADRFGARPLGSITAAELLRARWLTFCPRFDSGLVLLLVVGTPAAKAV